jgi:two-component system, LytTR family, response regulator
MQTDSIKVVIVEDQLSTRESIKYLLNGLNKGIEVVGEAANVDLAEQVIQKTEPHIVFLDVELTDGNSFSLLNKFINPAFSIVFITAHDEYAIKAIKFSALDYLLKPIDPAELEQAIDKHLFKTESLRKRKMELLVHNLMVEGKGQQKIALSSSKEICFVSLAEIIKLEGEKNYTTFYLDNSRKVMVSKTLKEYEELLEEFGFFRVHQSHIVNLSRVTKYLKGKGGYAVMDDGSTVEVSVRRKDDFLKALYS